MKKLVLLSAVALTVTVANAQNETTVIKKNEKSLAHQEAVIRKEKKADRKAMRKLEGTEVSPIAKDAFYADFGDISPVSWQRADVYDKATFTKHGREMSAYYDADGKLIGTTAIKTFSDIPANARRSILKRYAGYTPGKVIFYDDNEHNDNDMMLYGIQFEDEDNYFVELSKGNKQIVLQVNPEGNVFFFSELK